VAVKALFRRTRGNEAEATVAQVNMTERLSYGEAKVRVTYLVAPLAEPAFQAVREARVHMKFLPQAGQRVRVLYDPDTSDLLQVVTPPGQEGATPPGSEPTKEIPWNDSDHTRRRGGDVDMASID
jgi:hypothetical protein